MPRSATATRQAILDAAEHRLAVDGVLTATFADILDDAGQRNNSAIQYHFGDRVGLLEAITARRVEQMNARRDELLAELPEGATISELVEVITHPLAVLLDDPGGAAFLRIQAELLAHPERDQLPPLLSEPWRRPGIDRVHHLLEARLGARTPVLGDVRTLLITTLVVHALADRARVSTAGMDHTDFIAGLVDALVAILASAS